MVPPGGHPNLGPPPDTPPPAPPTKQGLMKEFKEMNKRVPTPLTPNAPSSEATEPPKVTKESKDPNIASKVLSASKNLFGIKEDKPSFTKPPTTEESFTKLLNLLNEVVGLEKISQTYESQQQRARLARAEEKFTVANTLDEHLAKELNSYESAVKRLETRYTKNHVSTPNEIGLMLKVAVNELLKTPAGVNFAASSFLQMKVDQERKLLVKMLAQLDTPTLSKLVQSLIPPTISKGSLALRETSLTSDLYRELHLKVYGSVLKPILQQWLQRNIIDTHGNVQNSRQSLTDLLTQFQNALQSSNEQTKEIHQLYGVMRQAFHKQKASTNEETPYLINVFINLVLAPLITDPTTMGLPSYPLGGEDVSVSPETKAAARLAAELTLYAKIIPGQPSLQDPVFGVLLKELLTLLDPSNAVKIMGY